MDRKTFFLGIGLAVVLVFCAAGIYTTLVKAPSLRTDRENLYQISTIDALMQGVFEGVEQVGELRGHGDFGIGTFDALDGEMIMLEGRIYQATADGSIRSVPDTATTPFATVTYFDRDFSAKTPAPMNFSNFSSTMSAWLPSQNVIYAVRMHGTFPAMKVRAIPAQHKPYPTLTEASKIQSVYSYTDTTGTIVGFYTPSFFKGLNVAGYHLHFISDDGQTGGHILDFTVPKDTTVEYDITPEFTMALPTSGAFTGIDLTKDLRGDLAKVEQ
jgi:acetolactate decarboxylase